MRSFTYLALALSLSLSPVPLAAAAAEIDPPAAARGEDAPALPVIQPEVVPAERPAISGAAEMEQLPARGSFWWLVGVVVVAGVILALVL